MNLSCLSLKISLHLIIMDFFSNITFVNSRVIHVIPVRESEEEEIENSSYENTSSREKSEILDEILEKAQFYQDIFSYHIAPLKIQFGHVCENPAEWEQRFEQKDFEKNHHQGKVLWGDINGNYGEHYWDFASG